MERSRAMMLSGLMKLGFIKENTTIRMTTPTKAVMTEAALWLMVIFSYFPLL